MPLDRQRQIRLRHAAAVVGDADEPPPAAIGDNLDAPRARIERVLDQFLDGAGRPLDHLAGGDAVDGLRGQAADGHGLYLGRVRAGTQGPNGKGRG